MNYKQFDYPHRNHRLQHKSPKPELRPHQQFSNQNSLINPLSEHSFFPDTNYQSY